MQPYETAQELNKREARFLEVQLWKAGKIMAGEPVPSNDFGLSSHHKYTTSDETDFINTLAHRNWGFFMKYAKLVLEGYKNYHVTPDDCVDVKLVKRHVRNLIDRHNRFEE